MSNDANNRARESLMEGSKEILASFGKRIRDPIHGDIIFNELEIEIMDTFAFQRLRRIKQLGTSCFIYPGLEHSRFQHSLGTLYMAQKMIEEINNNKFSKYKINNPYVILLIRLSALLHDIVNIPFGHTLEDEGNLLTPDWKDDERVEYFLGKDSEIGSIIIKNMGEKALQDIKFVLTAQDEDEIIKLEFPYIADIVCNTICADLLDYLKRDTYFAGLGQDYDPRFLCYLALDRPEESNKLRLVIRYWRNGRMRRDVNSEIFKLLRLRYSMAEKVYYHHAKIITSAMLIAGIYGTGKFLDNNKEFLFRAGDDELLYRLLPYNSTDNKIEDEVVEISKYIIERLRKRKLYKPIYQIDYLPPRADDKLAQRVHDLQKTYSNKKNRYELERNLEKQNKLPKGSIIIYCPSKKMSLKEAQAKVVWHDDKIYTLEQVADKGLDADIEKEIQLIKDKHKKLWKMCVYIDSDHIYNHELIKNVRSDCYLIFQIQNVLEKISEPVQHWKERTIIEFAETYKEPEGLEVTVPELRKLKDIVERDKSRDIDRLELEKRLPDMLKDLRKKK